MATIFFLHSASYKQTSLSYNLTLIFPVEQHHRVNCLLQTQFFSNQDHPTVMLLQTGNLFFCIQESSWLPAEVRHGHNRKIYSVMQATDLNHFFLQVKFRD